MMVETQSYSNVGANGAGLRVLGWQTYTLGFKGITEKRTDLFSMETRLGHHSVAH